MTIKLSEIIPAPWNTRGEITPESVKDLAESIKEQGLINPITVWKGEDGNGWYCIAGHRRIAALLSLGVDEAACTEFHGTEQDAKAVTITENLQREDVGVIEEANAVAALLDAGKSVEWIAARLGRGRNWVTRRLKIASLSDAWKKRAAKIDADALERISAYTPDVQEKIAKKIGENFTHWSEMRWQFDQEMRNLDAAKFDTKPCKKCDKRTGCQGDLFGECDGKLGSCLDCKCFEAKRNARIKAEIAEATKGADEIVRIAYAWQKPQETTEKRDKKHPCAYVFVDHNDGVEVSWGVSKKAEEERKKREEEARAADREAEDAKSAEIRAIKDKISDFAYDNEETAAIIESMVTADLLRGDRAAIDFAVKSVVDSITGWNNDEDYAAIMRAFTEFGRVAGLSPEDEEKFLAANPEPDDDADGDEDDGNEE